MSSIFKRPSVRPDSAAAPGHVCFYWAMCKHRDGVGELQPPARAAPSTGASLPLTDAWAPCVPAFASFFPPGAQNVPSHSESQVQGSVGTARHGTALVVDLGQRDRTREVSAQRKEE
ncbi:unnamed protein product [Pleuronectes platessa]|uniref:Uncharacterized protein n=1 Tax=Pleuronectes platessa TaxID=8262 RepID=A0A9N7ZC37_PLEPL|nr:unnamed protein product [Pleuronectes platessa]